MKREDIEILRDKMLAESKKDDLTSAYYQSLLYAIHSLENVLGYM